MTLIISGPKAMFASAPAESCEAAMNRGRLRFHVVRLKITDLVDHEARKVDASLAMHVHRCTE